MVHGARLYAAEIAKRFPDTADDIEQVRRKLLAASRYLNGMVNEMEDAA